jgi:hypothetical protein
MLFRFNAHGAHKILANHCLVGSLSGNSSVYINGSPERATNDMEILKLIYFEFVVALRQVFLLALRFSPVSYHSINAPYLSSIRCWYVNHG